MPLPALPLRQSLAILALALLLPLLAGCGSSGPTGASAPDPASVAPASAPLFVDATVSPQGSLSTNAITDARELTHLSSPFETLLSTLEGQGKIHFSWAEAKPWVGERAGLVITSFGGSQSALGTLERGLSGALGIGAAKSALGADGTQGALLLNAKDLTKARSFVSAQGRRSGAHGSSYNGVSYQVDSEGQAAAVVGSFVVIGGEDTVKEVIATSAGGASLLRAPAYAKLAANAEPDSLAHVYLSPAKLLGSIRVRGKGKTQGLLALRQLISDSQQVYLSLIPTRNSIALDIDTLAAARTTGGGLLASSAEGAQAMGELPGESWLAAGLGNTGVTLRGDVQVLRGLPSLLASLGGSSESSASNSFSVKGVLEGVLTPLLALSAPGAHTQRDFLSWMSSAGIFTSGTTVVNLRAGIVIDSKNPTLSHEAVAKLGALLSKAGGSVQPTSIPYTDAAISARVNGLPVELDIANGHSSNGQHKFVIGLGEASVQDALRPSSTMASTSAGIAKTLGDGARPSLTVSFPTLLTLLEGIGLGEDPSISKALPYLRSLTTLTGGARSLGGGVERYRLALGLQRQSG